MSSIAVINIDISSIFSSVTPFGLNLKYYSQISGGSKLLRSRADLVISGAYKTCFKFKMDHYEIVEVID
ncbi:unnamed protein product [Brassica oleracea]|uniref:Uncharacterized protein n=1 Tax=Brassica oleracea TaxID=3712 RepID=A0A3P6FUL2_BRAOL|nr:unnamed protein product [Brassica oleracea]